MNQKRSKEAKRSCRRMQPERPATRQCNKYAQPLFFSTQDVSSVFHNQLEPPFCFFVQKENESAQRNDMFLSGLPLALSFSVLSRHALPLLFAFSLLRINPVFFSLRAVLILSLRLALLCSPLPLCWFSSCLTVVILCFLCFLQFLHSCSDWKLLLSRSHHILRHQDWRNLIRSLKRVVSLLQQELVIAQAQLLPPGSPPRSPRAVPGSLPPLGSQASDCSWLLHFRSVICSSVTVILSFNALRSLV